MTDQRRRERNIKLLAKLENVEKKAAFLQAKTDRIKSLKSIYKNHCEKNQPTNPYESYNDFKRNRTARNNPLKNSYLHTENMFGQYMFADTVADDYQHSRYVIKNVTLEEAIEEISRRYILIPKSQKKGFADDKDEKYPNTSNRDSDGKSANELYEDVSLNTKQNDEKSTQKIDIEKNDEAKTIAPHDTKTNISNGSHENNPNLPNDLSTNNDGDKIEEKSIKETVSVSKIQEYDEDIPESNKNILNEVKNDIQNISNDSPKKLEVDEIPVQNIVDNNGTDYTKEVNELGNSNFENPNTGYDEYQQSYNTAEPSYNAAENQENWNTNVNLEQQLTENQGNWDTNVNLEQQLTEDQPNLQIENVDQYNYPPNNEYQNIDQANIDPNYNEQPTTDNQGTYEQYPDQMEETYPQQQAEIDQQAQQIGVEQEGFAVSEISNNQDPNYYEENTYNNQQPYENQYNETYNEDYQENQYNATDNNYDNTTIQQENYYQETVNLENQNTYEYPSAEPNNDNVQAYDQNYDYQQSYEMNNSDPNATTESQYQNEQESQDYTYNQNSDYVALEQNVPYEQTEYDYSAATNEYSTHEQTGEENYVQNNDQTIEPDVKPLQMFDSESEQITKEEVSAQESDFDFSLKQ